MTKHIVVTSNCITGGVASAIQYLCPDATVHPRPVFGGEDHTELFNVLRVADVWVSAFNLELAQSPVIQQVNPKLQVFKLPLFNFAAFHPDICYVKNRNTGQLTMPHYNSRIVAWCYNQGVKADNVEGMFEEAALSQLGYLDMWKRETDMLKIFFQQSDLDAEFDTLYRRFRRMGCFMHSINHPKVGVLIEISKAIVNKLGLRQIELSADVVFNDVLDGVSWPVYPGIASSLGIANGSFVFKLGERQIVPDLSTFIKYSYEKYAADGMKPGDLEFAHAPGPKFEDAINSLAR